jgi:hypothetical protein
MQVPLACHCPADLKVTQKSNNYSQKQKIKSLEVTSIVLDGYGEVLLE